jgi:hypothetical protein
MWIGFILAAYSVVGNDVIQTLGTFLTSNERRMPWYVLWIFAAVILSAALFYGWYNADISYGRLTKFNPPEVYHWYYLLPPIVLLSITRLGIPVSTTFMILTLFSLQNIPNELGEMVSSVFDTSQKLGGMIQKSLMGYVIAFGSALIIYLSISGMTEKYFINNPIAENRRLQWTILQWCTTGFLWFQWLTQDLANIYIYLLGGNQLNGLEFSISMFVLLAMLAYIFYNKGGAVQEVVRSKTNTVDIRSATFIDFIYGIILYIFKYDYFGLWGGKLPMSTTWVFIGLLAGRELGVRLMAQKSLERSTVMNILGDLFKVFLGLVISVVLVFAIKLMAQ